MRHATGRLEDLSISVLAIDTDDFAHQWHTTDGDVAYFVLGDRTVSLDGHEVRDDTFYTTFLLPCIPLLFCMRPLTGEARRFIMIILFS